MSRIGVRLLMVVVGVAVFALYAGAAVIGLLLLASLFSNRADLTTTIGIVVVLTLVTAITSYRFGTAALLDSLHATVLSREDAPGLYRLRDRLCDRMDLTPPQIAVARMAHPNALAIGGAGGGVIVLDRSLFRLLGDDEIEAILAHELAHLESRDALVQTLGYALMRTIAAMLLLALSPFVLLVTGLARAVGWATARPHAWADNPFGRLRRWAEGTVLVALLALTVLLFALSRRREYAADDRAVNITGNPLALARALRTIQRASQPRWGLLSPLVVYDEDEDPLTRLFSTHPAMEERVERLVQRASRSSSTVQVRID